MTKQALVWGASGGIGSELVAKLASSGWQVGAAARNTENLAALTPHRFTVDVADEYSIQHAVLAAAQELGEIDLWVYAVGDIHIAKADELSALAWQQDITANLTGAFLTTHHSLPNLAADAHLFYIGAISERLRLPGFGAYVAAKAGLEAFAAVLGKEERNRRVTVIRPGAVDTSFWEKLPMRIPKNALTPATVVDRILAAYAAGERGLLDVTE